uniref:Uncharacterized protein n=1 Tax=Glossina pallidipes TaxID=7398 RepID=A0A1A9Z6S5_GLOPL
MTGSADGSKASGVTTLTVVVFQFGPVVFTIIMTLGQTAAILLSCVIYHHIVTTLGVLGVIIVFLATLLRLQLTFICNYSFVNCALHPTMTIGFVTFPKLQITEFKVALCARLMQDSMTMVVLI